MRELIASWHGAQSEDVLVTVGATEANSIAVGSLVHPDEHVITMQAGHRQVRSRDEIVDKTIHDGLTSEQVLPARR